MRWRKARLELLIVYIFFLVHIQFNMTWILASNEFVPEDPDPVASNRECLGSAIHISPQTL
jgi:hypothetical protein